MRNVGASLRALLAGPIVLAVAGCAAPGVSFHDLDGVTKACPGNLPPAALQQCTTNYVAQRQAQRQWQEAQEQARRQAEERRRQAETRRQYCDTYLPPAPETPDINGHFAYSDTGACLAEMSPDDRLAFARREQQRLDQRRLAEEAARQRAAAEAQAKLAEEAEAKKRSDQDADLLAGLVFAAGLEYITLSAADSTHDCLQMAVAHGLVDTVNSALADAAVEAYFKQHYAGSTSDKTVEGAKLAIHALLEGNAAVSLGKDVATAGVQKLFPNDPFFAAYSVNAAAYYEKCKREKQDSKDGN